MNVAATDRKPLTHRDKRLIRAAGIASVTVALVLVGIKIWAWRVTGSVAMLSTLADSILDLLASTMTLIAVRFALEPADREHRFGHGKLEAIAGLIQSIIISGSAVYVGFEAISRLLTPAPVAAPVAGIIVMLTSLVLTISLLLFQQHVVRSTGSLAIGADALHYKSDILTNIGVLAAIGVSLWFGWHIADPIIGLVVVFVILGSVNAIVRKSLDVLLDRELSGARRKEIVNIAMAHDQVLGVHDLRTRTSGTHDFIQFHLELRPEMSLRIAHEISDQVEAAVMEAFPRAEVIIHADPHGLDEPQDDF